METFAEASVSNQYSGDAVAVSARARGPEIKAYVEAATSQHPVAPEDDVVTTSGKQKYVLITTKLREAVTQSASGSGAANQLLFRWG